MNQTAGRLAGKATIITGAASGIGQATARLFAAHGALLLLNDVDGAVLEEEASRLKVKAFKGDIGEEADVAAMLEACVVEYGRVDVVVANAGIFHDADALAVTSADWDRVMATDGRGTFLTCKHAIRVMAEQKAGGSIVCVSSISGVAGQHGQAAYGPAKFIVSGLAKHLAVEWAHAGIRVNAVAPGTIATSGLRFVPPKKQEQLRQRHPLGRFGTPDEVAQAILFLASDDASFVTGVVLPVDGGYLAQ